MAGGLDFLSLGWRAADRYLLGLRERLTNSSAESEKIGDCDVVLLVALDGAADHKQYHPACSAQYYVDFCERCCNFMKGRGGKVVPPTANGEFDYVACGWFSAAFDAVAAAAGIREWFRDAALTQRGSWVHERHAVGAVGRSEYAAYRLLQMSMRDRTLVDPLVWERLDSTARDLLSTCGVQPPDQKAIKEETSQFIAENVERARTAYLRLQARALQSLGDLQVKEESLADVG